MCVCDGPLVPLDGRVGPLDDCVGPLESPEEVVKQAMMSCDVKNDFWCVVTMFLHQNNSVYICCVR